MRAHDGVGVAARDAPRIGVYEVVLCEPIGLAPARGSAPPKRAAKGLGLTGLRERIRTGQKFSPSAEEDQVREAILENLRALCGTRLGTMLSCADFGLPCLVESLVAQESTRLIADALKRSIDQYEPRLRAVRVRALQPEGVILHFEITAQLVATGADGTQKEGTRGRSALGQRPRMLQFSTHIDADKAIRVA